jgi:chaperonin GroES
MKELQPVNQNVVLDISGTNQEQRTASGLIIPDSAKEKTNIAPIIWMSIIENAEVKPGDVVVYKPYSGTEIEFEGKKLLVIQYSEILATIVETEEI